MVGARLLAPTATPSIKHLILYMLPLLTLYPSLKKLILSIELLRLTLTLVKLLIIFYVDMVGILMYAPDKILECVYTTVYLNNKFYTYNKLTPSVLAVPSATPNNFRLPKDKVPFTDTAPLLVVIIAVVD